MDAEGVAWARVSEAAETSGAEDGGGEGGVVRVTVVVAIETMRGEGSAGWVVEVAGFAGCGWVAEREYLEGFEKGWERDLKVWWRWSVFGEVVR